MTSSNFLGFWNPSLPLSVPNSRNLTSFGKKLADPLPPPSADVICASPLSEISIWLISNRSRTEVQCTAAVVQIRSNQVDGLHRFRAGMEHGMDVSCGLRQWATPSIRRATVAKRELGGHYRMTSGRFLGFWTPPWSVPNSRNFPSFCQNFG